MKRGPKEKPFDEWYTAEPNTGCWLWTGSRNQKGYGWSRIQGISTRMAHRISWLLHRGDIPEGVLVCHKCDTPSCVNPDHLFLGTQKDNLLDMSRKGRSYRGGPPPKRMVFYRGKTMALHRAAKLAGMGISTVWARVRRGWSLEDAVSLPLKWGDNR